MDIILRSAHLFERIIVAVLVNAEKKPLFTADERVAIIREVFREYPNVEVDTFDGLLVDYARRRRASAIVRGLRAVSDFEYEFQMALMNRHLEPTLETVFMMPAEQYTYLSSRLIKEVFSLGGDVRGLVPPAVEAVDAAEAGAAGASEVRSRRNGHVCTAMAQVSASATLKVAAEAERLRRAGYNVVDFSAGEPDFPTPEHVKAAGKAAIDANFTRYTRGAGHSGAARGDLRALQGATTASTSPPAEVLMTVGGKQALFNTALALFDPGRRGDHARAVLADDPRAGQAGGRACRSSCRRARSDGFAVHAERIIAAITPKTKAIILNSPCNPTGALIDEATLAAIADAAAKRGIWIIVDLCYEQLIYEDVPHNLPKVLFDRHRDRTVLAGSASKAYAMTGWRCGWTIAPKELTAAFNVDPGTVDVEHHVDHAEGGAGGVDRTRRMRSPRCWTSIGRGATTSTRG